MKVLAHLDPFVLEAELLDRVAAVKRDDPLAPVLVVVPTVFLARHVRLRLAERLGACLAVEVAHHRSLALSILDREGGPRPRAASRILEESLLAGVLSRLDSNPLSRHARDLPGTVGALLGTLRELREAGIGPEEVETGARTAGERALASVYRAFSSALEERRGAGFADDVALVRDAAALAPARAARYRAILHHGAYELIGVHLDLVLGLDRGREVTFLLPAQPGSEVSAYAERFASRHLLGEGGEIERISRPGAGLLGDRLGALYDEPSEPAPLPEGAVRFRHAQGARAEILAAVRRALASADAGTRPREIAIVARSLEPFVAGAHEILEDGPLAYSSSLASPLRREPEVRDLLLLLRAAAASFPRAATAEILASPRVRWRALGIEAAPPGDLAEAWSRRAGIVGGVEAWADDLVRWAGSAEGGEEATEGEREAEKARARARVAEARRIADAVLALRDACGGARPRTWPGHADLVEDLARRAFAPPAEGRPGSPLETLAGLLDDMRALPALLGDSREVPFEEMVSWLERAADGASLAPRRADGGGIRLLDAMQGRGMTFDRVFLLGMNSGVFPRVAREDPFLRDEARERLRAATGKPLPVKREGASEERLLLALVLGSARERLEVSWQRADETGRAKAASIALREIARLASGRPDLDAVRPAPESFPSHPLDRLEAMEADPGLLSPEEGALLLALRGPGRENVAKRLAEVAPSIAGGLSMLLATESFAPAPTGWDARVGAAASPPARMTVTSLERLGRCPLQFFFRHVLRAYELEEAPSHFEIPAAEMGGRVHALLQALYARLRDEELFGRDRGARLLRRAEAILGEEWNRAFSDLGERAGTRLPVLWETVTGRWRSSLLEFLRDDLARISSEGAAPRDLERTVRTRISFGEGKEAEIEGRLDRVLDAGGEVVVSDYKTSGDLKNRVRETRVLRGQEMQAPLYSRLAGGARVEFLGVGPSFESGPGLEEETGREVFERSASAELAAGFDDTIRVLLALVEAGRFPLREGDHCGWCPYDRACRRTHPPTLFREANAPDAADYFDVVAGKTSKLRTLAEVRAAGARGGEEE